MDFEATWLGADGVSPIMIHSGGAVFRAFFHERAMPALFTNRHRVDVTTVDNRFPNLD